MGLFLCCHEQVKKILEAFSRSHGRLPYREKGEIILCINVFRYLPKEKEETNFPHMHGEIRPSEKRASQGTKKETNPSL